MKRRLLATVCSAAILANMVPYQAFADNAQATPETAQSIALDSAAQAFADDGQSKAYNYKMKVAVSGVDGGYVKAGDTVKVTISISDAAWATAENKAGLIAMNLELRYDSDVFKPLPKTRTLGKAFLDAGYDVSGFASPKENFVTMLIECPDPDQDEDDLS